MSAFQLYLTSWSFQNLPSLSLKLFTDSALTTVSGKLFHSVLTLIENETLRSKGKFTKIKPHSDIFVCLELLLLLCWFCYSSVLGPSGFPLYAITFKHNACCGTCSHDPSVPMSKMTLLSLSTLPTLCCSVLALTSSSVAPPELS